MQQNEHDAGGSAPSIGGGAVEQAKGAARDVADEARGTAQSLKAQAGELADTVKDGLTAQAEQQKHAVATRIDRVAERVLQAAGDLHGDEAWLSSWLERGAYELSGFADELKRNDVAGLVETVQVFARRQPAVFMGVGVALGFAIARVLRSGSQIATEADRGPRHGRDEPDRPAWATGTGSRQAAPAPYAPAYPGPSTRDTNGIMGSH